MNKHLNDVLELMELEGVTGGNNADCVVALAWWLFGPYAATDIRPILDVKHYC